ncbi:Hydrolase [Petrocella atlantisensis]|uniref:Hydrolase n=2 Tax=Petrocella atlantisensis TaxID=2173034 RepID=A0A3P7PDP8_9FIRM|nr:Hydrolase [Petrocella atlantisensis]
MAKMTLEALIEKVDDIPAFPQTVINIMALLKEPRSAAVDIEREVMKDQGLTTKLLKMANSAFYSGRRQIKTVADATVLLGFDTVQTLVLASTVGKVMEKELKGYSYERNALWRQSQISAIMARTIAKKAKYANPDIAYTAGLLKDVGKVILDEYVHESYQEILTKISNEVMPYVAAEEEILGFNHGQVGARIVEKWNLASELVDAIEFHHKPFQSIDNIELVSIVHISDGLVMMMGIHEGIDTLGHEFFTDAVKILNLDEADLNQIMKDVEKIVSEEQIFI